MTDTSALKALVASWREEARKMLEAVWDWMGETHQLPAGVN